jgi:signal transduction histidine kinase
VSPRLRIYVTAVIAAAIALLAVLAPHDVATRWQHYLGWVVICVASESLWLPTLSGSGTVSMASSAGLAAGVLWGAGASAWIVALSTLLAELFVQRKPWVRATFNAAQGAITMVLASGAFVLLGGPVGGLEHARPLGTGEMTALRLALPVLGLFAVYLVVNRALVATAVAWSAERPYLRVLREDWFYTERLLSDAAAFLLSPLMVISFQAIGYVGVALFYGPLRILNESHRRYLELQAAQRMLIHTERMAAKGEMAAEIGHELNNILSAISARAQMIAKDADRGAYENVTRNTGIILEQSKRMEVMSKGLRDFSRAELSVERVDVNGLIERTVELMRTQNRFDGVEWDLRLAEPHAELRGDPGQLQQVLVNLFLNASDAMKEKNSGARTIGVTTTRDDRARQICIVVTDTGTGIAASNLARIFEPHFTTKATGHGFGLSTTYRIIEGHRGKIVAHSPLGQGASFIVTLPMYGQGGWS